jgi:signal transduction histidine kinase
MSQANSQAVIQEEQNRLFRFLHDRMSPQVMEVAFVVETLVADLETTRPDVAAKKVEKIRQLLGDLFDEMHLLFAPPLAQQPPGSRPA